MSWSIKPKQQANSKGKMAVMYERPSWQNSIPKWCWKMFEFGQALNAGHSPLANITSDLTRIELSDFRQWRKYLIMMPVELSCVDAGDDAVSGFSCFPKSVLSQVNEIACLGQLKGSHRNSPRGCGGTRGGIWETRDQLLMHLMSGQQWWHGMTQWQCCQIRIEDICWSNDPSTGFQVRLKWPHTMTIMIWMYDGNNIW